MQRLSVDCEIGLDFTDVGYKRRYKMNKKVAKLTHYNDECGTCVKKIGYYDMDVPTTINETGIIWCSLKVGHIKLDDIIKDIMNKGYDEVIVPKYFFE